MEPTRFPDGSSAFEINSDIEKILFLDFDGVLHPEPCTNEQMFAQLAMFEETLLAYPDWRIVFSTTWRVTHKWERLVSIFSVPLHHRFIGCNPVFSKFAAQTDIPRFVREQECKRWMRNNHFFGKWLALDDRTWEFTPFCPNLVACDAKFGFTDRIQQNLASKFSE